MGLMACRYCGQIIDLDFSADSESDAIEYATLKCECDEAQKYQTRISYFERAKKAIEEEFTEDYLKALLLATVQHVYDGKIYGITLKVDGENTVKISQDSKGNIFVTKLFSTGSKIQL